MSEESNIIILDEHAPIYAPERPQLSVNAEEHVKKFDKDKKYAVRLSLRQMGLITEIAANGIDEALRTNSPDSALHAALWKSLLNTMKAGYERALKQRLREQAKAKGNLPGRV